MSYDFYISKVCSHTIVDEVVVLENEASQSFGFARRPSSTNITITVDGVEIPRTGLYSKAEIVCLKGEPYRIKYGKNDLILFKNGSGAVQTIQLPPGNFSAKALSDYLYTKIPNLDVTSENGRLIIRSLTATNGTAFSFPDPRWTDKSSSLITTSRILAAYNLLGITPGRVGSGRKLFPGYKVLVNPAAFVEEWIVTFDTPIPNNTPVILVTYQTQAAFCGRCIGSRLEYDYTIKNSTYETIKDTDLLVQEVNKFMFTVKGSHWKWPWLGSALVTRIGQKADTAASLASSFIGLDINGAFNVYQNIKKQQDIGFPGQNVTDAEFPLSLSNFTVTSGDDPTTFYANFTVISRSRDPLVVTKTISVPDPYQLTSSPTGVIQQASTGYQLVG